MGPSPDREFLDLARRARVRGFETLVQADALPPDVLAAVPHLAAIRDAAAGFRSAAPTPTPSRDGCGATTPPLARQLPLDMPLPMA